MKPNQLNSFILQTNDRNLFYFFYTNDGNISYSIYSNNHWSNPKTVIERVNYNFSVNLTEKDDIYVFCQDLKGNVILCLYQNKNWSSKTILENKVSEIYDINFQMLFDNKNLSLIYSMPIIGEKSSHLIYHSMDNNRWNSPQILDTIIPFKGLPFVLQNINSNLNIAFYERKGKESSLGYREFSVPLQKWSNFNPFHTTFYTYTDQSFLTTENTIHTLFLVRTNFSYQLIYRYKEGLDWSMPNLIYEGGRVETCSMFILENQLWILWYINSNIYVSISQNLGKSFNKPIPYKGNYPSIPVKATFITNLEQKESQLYTRELILNGQSIPEIAIVPELYPDFYSPIESKSDTVTSIQSVNPDNSLREKIVILENKISSYETELAEKNAQINSMIKEKNILIKTKEILENQISEQSSELSSLQKQIEQITEQQSDNVDCLSQALKNDSDENLEN